MTAFSAYKQGIKFTFKAKKIWLWLYLINIGVALLAAIPFFNYLDEKAGHSLEMDKWLEGFNYTLFSDFMNEYGDGLQAIMGQSQLLLLVFFVLYAFLTGGILTIFKNYVKAQEDSKSFLEGCATFFWRMLRLAIYFLIMHGFILGVFGALFIAIIGGGLPEDIGSEVKVVNALKIMIPIFLLFVTIISMVHDYAKIQLVDQNPKWLFSLFGEAFGFVFRNFRKVFFLYVLNILTFLSLFGLYWLISSAIAAQSMGSIICAFLVGQLFLIARIGMKMLNLGSATCLYKNIQSSSN